MTIARRAAAFDELLTTTLALTSPPVGLAFVGAAPPGVDRVSGPAPSGCTYWKDAAAGRVFYTEASDHFGCPVGAHTHNAAMPPEKVKELEGMIGTMVGLRYLKGEEVAAIPRRERALEVAVYGPLRKLPVDPDVVLVRGDARQLMLLLEAATAAGLAKGAQVMGRPTCAMIPASLASGEVTTNLGCIGNRVYTGLADTELYAAIPAAGIDALSGELAAIAAANVALEKFHTERRDARP
jgi:uncharacterized protein (DUF169 family)